MSSFRRGILILGWLVVAAGCGEDRDQAVPFDPGSSEPATADTVHFAAAGLEAVVRVALGSPRGPLATEQLLTLTQLDARQRGIVDLAGIEQLQGLATLDLADNRISDLTPLTALAGLRALRLGNNRITELHPLSVLRHLRQLDLEGNRIVDPSPLAGLDSLQTLILDFN
jgi:hypothetical protein